MKKKLKKLKRLIRSHFKKHLKTMSSRFKKLRLLIRSKIKQICADLSTLKNAFWYCKTGLLPVFLETLVKYILLLVLAYVLTIYVSAYFIFKIHGLFYHEFGYIIGFVTAALIFDFPVILHNYILMVPTGLGLPRILMEALQFYFTYHWDYALALGLICSALIYFLACVCKLVWTTLERSNNHWDRLCAYLILALLVTALLSFCIYLVMPFFQDAFRQGGWHTLISYLWKSLKGFEASNLRGEAKDTSYQGSSKANTPNSKAYSPKERTWFDYVRGKPKPAEDFNSRQGMHQMSHSTHKLNNNVSSDHFKKSKELKRELNYASQSNNLNRVQYIKGQIEGYDEAYESTSGHIQEALQEQSKVQNRTVHEPAPAVPKNFWEAAVNGANTFTTKVAEGLAPEGIKIAKAGQAAGIKGAAAYVNSTEESGKINMFMSKGLQEQLRPEKQESIESSDYNIPESPSKSSHNPF